MHQNNVHYSRAVAAVLLAIILPTGISTDAGADPAWPTPPGVEIGLVGVPNHLPSGYEPSGAVWHQGRSRLLVVSDDGYISEMGGDSVTTWDVGGNLEAIALPDPMGDLVLVGQEHPDAIHEFSLATGQLTGNSWDLTPWMTGPMNKGLEALTLIGPLAYVGHQDTGEIFIFQLLGGGVVVHIATLPPALGLDGLSGLDWHVPTSTLFALFGKHELLLEMTATGIPFRGYGTPGDHEEGIAVIAAPEFSTTGVFIAEDPAAGQGPREVWFYWGYPIQPIPSTTNESAARGVQLQAFPNPFHRTTIIRNHMSVEGPVTVAVHDVLGRRVRELVSGVRPAGRNDVIWDGRDDHGRILPSGMYVVRLKTPDGTRAIKLAWNR